MAARVRHPAVAVAAALKADECLIYTDVDGVYTPIRAWCPSPPLKTVTFEEMLEMASIGSKNSADSARSNLPANTKCRPGAVSFNDPMIPTRKKPAQAR